MRTSSGLPTEAVCIFSNMMRKLLDDHKPEYLAAVWEGEGPTFRDELFERNRDSLNYPARPRETLGGKSGTGYDFLRQV